MTLQFSDMTSSSIFFNVVLFLLSSFHGSSRFHVNIVSGTFYKELTRNLEIGNTLVFFCSISGDWGELGIPNLARTTLIKCYWMLQNARVAAFYLFWLIKGNNARTHAHTQIMVKQVFVLLLHDLSINFFFWTRFLFFFRRIFYLRTRFLFLLTTEYSVIPSCLKVSGCFLFYFGCWECWLP